MTKEKIKENRIVIFGSFTGRNKGDLAILRSELIQLKKNAQKKVIIYIFSKEAERLHQYISDIILDEKNENNFETKIFGSFTSYIGLRTLPILVKSDKVIIGGGGLFFDDRLFDISFNHLLNIFILSFFIRLLRKDTMIYAVGCAKFKSRIGRWMMKFILNSVEVVSVRHKLSRKVVSECTDKDIELGCDPAFLLEPKKTKRVDKIINSFPKGKIILLAVHKYIFLKEKLPDREDVLKKFVGQVSWFASQKGYSILTYSNYTNQEFAKKIAKYCGEPAKTMLSTSNHLLPEELIYLISKVDFVIASQMHVGIFSYLASVPFINLIYHEKVEQFNLYVGNENYLYLSQMTDNQKVSDALSKAAAGKPVSQKPEVKIRSEKLSKLLNDFVWN